MYARMPCANCLSIGRLSTGHSCLLPQYATPCRARAIARALACSHSARPTAVMRLCSDSTQLRHPQQPCCHWPGIASTGKRGAQAASATVASGAALNRTRCRVWSDMASAIASDMDCIWHLAVALAWGNKKTAQGATSGHHLAPGRTPHPHSPCINRPRHSGCQRS